MRRWMIYVAAAAIAVSLKPGNRKDVGTLIPVELLYINREAGRIQVQTDTGEMGTGKTLAGALEDLKATAPGEVFLETADYLIVTERTVNLLSQLTQMLRPGTEVCVGVNADAQAASYLKAHPPGVSIKDIKAGENTLPTLIKSKERYHFGENWKFRQTA